MRFSPSRAGRAALEFVARQRRVTRCSVSSEMSRRRAPALAASTQPARAARARASEERAAGAWSSPRAAGGGRAPYRARARPRKRAQARRTGVASAADRSKGIANRGIDDQDCRVAALACAGSLVAQPAASGGAGAPAAADPAELYGVRESVEQIDISPDGSRVVYLQPGPGRDDRRLSSTISTAAASRAWSIRSDGDPERLRWCNFVTNERLICQVAGMIGGRGHAGSLLAPDLARHRRRES